MQLYMIALQLKHERLYAETKLKSYRLNSSQQKSGCVSNIRSVHNVVSCKCLHLPQCLDFYVMVPVSVPVTLFLAGSVQWF